VVLGSPVRIFSIDRVVAVTSSLDMHVIERA
jgi:hypothetical protein